MIRHRKPENFISAVNRNGHGLSEEAELTPREAADEALVMGLRLVEGIDPAKLASRLGVGTLIRSDAVRTFTTTGHLRLDGTRLSATPAGRLVLDHLLAEIAA